MTSSTMKILPLLFLLIIQVMNVFPNSLKPVMSPDETEKIINEGESIELTCTGHARIEFYYPNISNSITNLIQPNSTTSNHDRQYFSVKFFRRNATSDDTGYYGCAYYDTKIRKNIYNQSEASWVYIYVQSHKKLFVTVEHQSIPAYEGWTTDIPCRPTSPDYPVTLYHMKLRSQNYEKVQLSHRVTFDPKFGFEIRNIHLKDIGFYKCEVMLEENTSSAQLMVILRVDHLPKLKIETTPQIAIEGRTFSLKCEIYRISTSVGSELQWKTRNGNVYENSTSKTGRITSNVAISDREDGVTDVTNILTINNMTLSDAGNYTCQFLSNDRSRVILVQHQYIRVYNPKIYPIILTPSIKDKRIEVCVGENVTLSVAINSPLTMDDSKIEVKWILGLDREISTDEKYNVTTTKNSTQLVISNVQFEDTRSYYVKVSSIVYSTVLEFRVIVWLPPVVNFDTKLQSHYKPLTDIKFECNSTKPPTELNITWYYQKYNASSRSYEQQELLENPVEKQSNSGIKSMIFLKTNSSGKIICSVCNTIKCSSGVKFVTIADEILEIRKSPAEVIEGSNVKVTCTGSLFYYNNVTWYNSAHEQIKENERIKFSVQKSSYNFTSSIMNISSVMKSEENAYVCGATANGSTVFQEVALSVTGNLPPGIIQSNMNGSEVVYDLKTARQMTISLTCYVEGSPKPTISWSKDDQRIVEDNKTYQFFDKKQLLKITPPDKTYSGIYNCTAVNDQGVVSVSLIVTIREQLDWRIIIGIAVAAVVCIGLGISGAIVYWRKKRSAAGHHTTGTYAYFNHELIVNDPVQNERLLSTWEFPRKELILERRLGIGQFGQVVRGTARGIPVAGTDTVVAVKMARKLAGSVATSALAGEFKVLDYLGKHINILNLLGVVQDTDKGLLLVLEFCPFGNFENYLLKCRNNFFSPVNIKTTSDAQSMRARLQNKMDINGRSTRRNYAYSYISQYIDSDQPSTSRGIEEPDSARALTVDPDCPPNLHRDYESEIILIEDLLIWAFQVALGIEYVSRKKVVHGDLAARNILLTENNVVKICDFGLAKKLYNTDCYRKKRGAPLPIKWMAIESIQHRLFTVQSDVWSYGVLLWEIFTLADPPFEGFKKPQELFEHLSMGHRLEKTKYMTDDIYKIMYHCWKHDPKKRPTFPKLVETIGKMLPKHVRKHFIDLTNTCDPST